MRCWALVFAAAKAVELTHIPPMPDIDQISTDEEWAAMMEEYEAVQVLRGRILRGEISLEQAMAPEAPAAPVAAAVPAAPAAAPAAYAAPAAPAAPVAAAVPVAPAAPAAPAAYAAPAAVGAPAAPAAAADPIAARQEAVGSKVDDMMNAQSDEEWNKMMEQYNKALSANPV